MNFHVIAAASALAGLLFGYDTGVVSGALLLVGTAGAFLACAGLSLVALALVAVMVPETKGRGLGRLEDALAAGERQFPSGHARPI